VIAPAAIARPLKGTFQQSLRQRAASSTEAKWVFTPAALNALTTGVELDDGIATADRAKRVGAPHNATSVVELVMHSGRNRVVRRMLEAVGHPVIDLHRRSFGSLHLGGLKPGHWRDLTRVEVSTLLTLADKSVEFTKEFSDDSTD